MKGWKSTLGRIGLLAGSLLLTLSAIECALRTGGYDPLAASRDGRDLILRPSPFEDVGYELTPGASGHAWGTDVAINAQGHRGRLGVSGGAPGFQAIALGDSITFGNFLPEAATFPSQLEQILNEDRSGQVVLNFGVGGYDTLQEVALLEHRGLDYRPDLVIVGYCLNDIGVVSPNLEYIERVRRYQSNPAFRLRVVQFVADRLDRLRTRDWMAEKNDLEVFRRDFAGRIDPIGREESELRALMESVPDLPPSAWYRSEERVGRLRHAFGRLARLARENDFPVIVAIVPWLVGSGDSYPHAAAHRIVALEAARAGFETVDVTPAFLAVGMSSLRVSPQDPLHPNPLGHRIIAESLAARIRALQPPTR